MQDFFRGYAVFLRLLQLMYGLPSFTGQSQVCPFATITLVFAPMTQDSQYERVQVIDEQDVITKENHP